MATPFPTDLADMQRRLRIVHWYWQSGAGGIDRLVQDLAFEQRGHPGLDIEIVTGKHSALAQAQNWSGTADAVGLRHGFDFLRLGRVRKRLAGIDLLHMHVYNPVVALAARLERCPVVYTDHGTDHGRSMRKLFVVWLLQRRFVRSRPRVLTVNSEYRRRTQEAFYGLDAGKMRLIYNGMRFDEFSKVKPAPELRASLGLAPDAFVVGTVALFQPRKRLSLLVDVFADLQIPGARLVIVGDGEGADELRAHIHARGVADQTILTGFRSDAREIMALFDAFVLPTKGEPFGLAATEALAMERPVIVFQDGGGLVEILRHRETGFVVANKDEAVERIRELHADPELGRALARRGRQDVADRFHISTMASELLRCYQDAGATLEPTPSSA